MSIKFGIIGAGRIGKIHAQNIFFHPKCSISKVYDINTKSSNDLAKKFNAKITLKDIDIFKDKEINAILIASSTPTHIKYLELAHEFNKDVYCEKPIHLNLKLVDKCLTKLKGHKNKIQLGFHRRFDPSHLELKKKLLKNKFGRIEQINLCDRDPGLPPLNYLKVSGGIFKDMTIHGLDVIRWILGEEITEVFAQGETFVNKKLKSIPDYDTTSIFLKSKSGVLCHIVNSRRHTCGFDQRVEVFCQKGSLSLKNNEKTSVVEISSKGVLHDNYPFSFIERYTNAYKLALNYFIDCIIKDIDPEPTLIDGRNSLAIAEALTLSAKTSNKIKVKLK
jgi:myo-inositol 2-dehydrogenase/D-chiro-inositol 1-dehydrogenase